jgi:hypothetical protein
MKIELDRQGNVLYVNLTLIDYDVDYESIMELEEFAAITSGLPYIAESKSRITGDRRDSEQGIFYESMSMRIENPTKKFEEYLAVWCFKS